MSTQVERLRLTALTAHSRQRWGNPPPRLCMMTERAGRPEYNLHRVPVHENRWSASGDQAVVLDALEFVLLDSARAACMGFTFTSEGWMTPELPSMSEADRRRAMQDASNRQLWQRPDRISVRLTFAADRWDNYVSITETEIGHIRTVWDSQANEEDMIRTVRASAIPLALRRMVDRTVGPDGE